MEVYSFLHSVRWRTYENNIWIFTSTAARIIPQDLIRGGKSYRYVHVYVYMLRNVRVRDLVLCLCIAAAGVTILYKTNTWTRWTNSALLRKFVLIRLSFACNFLCSGLRITCMPVLIKIKIMWWCIHTYTYYPIYIYIHKRAMTRAHIVRRGTAYNKA